MFPPMILPLQGTGMLAHSAETDKMTAGPPLVFLIEVVSRLRHRYW